MANTYTQIHIQVVFTVQNRYCIIQETWKNELYKYISGIVKNHNHKVLAINGMPDHIHILIGITPTQSLSDLMQDVKRRQLKMDQPKEVYQRLIFLVGRFWRFQLW